MAAPRSAIPLLVDRPVDLARRPGRTDRRGDDVWKQAAAYDVRPRDRAPDLEAIPASDRLQQIY